MYSSDSAVTDSIVTHSVPPALRTRVPAGMTTSSSAVACTPAVSRGKPKSVAVVVVLTTSRADRDVIQSYELGVNSFISKPVTFTGLVEAMNVLGRYWLEIVELPPTPADEAMRRRRQAQGDGVFQEHIADPVTLKPLTGTGQRQLRSRVPVSPPTQPDRTGFR